MNTGQNQSVVAVNTSNGIEIWRFGTGGLVRLTASVSNSDSKVFSGPVLSPDGSVLYFQAGDCMIHAVHALNGTQMWSSFTGFEVNLASRAIFIM